MITGLNHITLAVSNLADSLEFYGGMLGLKQVHVWSKGAYLEAGNVWICLAVSDAIDHRNDYTHIALSTDEEGFSALASRIEAEQVVIWKSNESEGDSIYFLDPDGHKLEIHLGSLESRMQHIQQLQGVSGECWGSN